MLKFMGLNRENEICTKNNTFTNRFAQTNGVTIVALVTTIVILLILAGISIVTLTGENGLIKKARKSKRKCRNRWGKRSSRSFYRTSDAKKQIW